MGEISPANKTTLTIHKNKGLKQKSENSYPLAFLRIALTTSLTPRFKHFSLAAIKRKIRPETYCIPATYPS